MDDGISGSTGGERPDFQRLVSDAKLVGDFDTIIAYDMARFGRMDSDETGFLPVSIAAIRRPRFIFERACWKCRRRDERDYSSGVASAETTILRQISRDTLRGQIQAAKAGWASGRAAAFGFDRVLVDQNGVQQKRLKRGERYVKDRSWHVTLTRAIRRARLMRYAGSSTHTTPKKSGYAKSRGC